MKVVVHSYFVLNRRRLCAFVMLDDLLGLSPTVLVDRPSERGATRSDGQPLATGQPLQVLSLQALGHPAKNDCSTEVLLDFCTRATFLRSVPVICVLTMTRQPGCASCTRNALNNR